MRSWAGALSFACAVGVGPVHALQEGAASDARDEVRAHIVRLRAEWDTPKLADLLEQLGPIPAVGELAARLERLDGARAIGRRGAGERVAALEEECAAQRSARRFEDALALHDRFRDEQRELLERDLRTADVTESCRAELVEILGLDPEQRDRVERSRARQDEAVALVNGGRHEEGLLLMLSELEELGALLDDASPKVLWCLRNAATVLRRTSRPTPADFLVREAIARHLRADDAGLALASTLLTAARVQRVLGRLDDCEQLFRSSLAIRLARPDAGGLEVADVANLLSQVLRDQGRFEASATLAHAVHRLRERALGPAHAKTLISLGTLAHLDYFRGDLRSAVDRYRQLGSLAQEGGLWDARDEAASEANLAQILTDLGDLRDAELSARRGAPGLPRRGGLVRRRPHRRAARARPDRPAAGRRAGGRSSI